MLMPTSCVSNVPIARMKLPANSVIAMGVIKDISIKQLFSLTHAIFVIAHWLIVWHALRIVQQALIAQNVKINSSLNHLIKSVINATPPSQTVKAVHSKGQSV